MPHHFCHVEKIMIPRRQTDPPSVPALPRFYEEEIITGGPNPRMHAATLQILCIPSHLWTRMKWRSRAPQVPARRRRISRLRFCCLDPWMILVRQRPMCEPRTPTAGSTPTVDLAILLFPISCWVSHGRLARNLSGIDIRTKALRFEVGVDH